MHFLSLSYPKLTHPYSTSFLPSLRIPALPCTPPRLPSPSSRWVALCGTFYYAHTNEATSLLKTTTTTTHPHPHQVDQPNFRPSPGSRANPSASPSPVNALVQAWRERFELVCVRHLQGLTASGPGLAAGQGLGPSAHEHVEDDSSTSMALGIGIFNEDNDEGAGDECGWLAVPAVARRVRWEEENAGMFAKALLAEPVVLCGLLKLSDALAVVLGYSLSMQGLAQRPGLGQGLGSSNGGGSNMGEGKAVGRIPHSLLLSLASLARSVLKA